MFNALFAKFPTLLTLVMAGAPVAEGKETTPTDTWITSLMTFGSIALIGVAFWFFLIRPQKKQEKETQKMRNSIGVGDTVTTIGGITGVVRQVKEEEDTYIIESGADKNKIAIKKWAVQSKDNKDEAVAPVKK